MNTPLTKTELNKAIEEINETAATKLRAMEKAENTMKHKHAELIKAWADGAEIQVKAHKLVWEDRENPLWDADSEYRIKPEPKPDVVECVLLWRIDRCGMTQPVGEFRLVTDGETGKLKSAEVLK